MKRKYTSAGDCIRRQQENAEKEAQKNPTDIPLSIVFNELPSIWIDDNLQPSARTARQADELFDRLILRQPEFKRSKISEKRKHFRLLVHAGKKAARLRGCVVHQRGFHAPGFSKIKVQVYDVAVSAGLFYAYRSPPGAVKCSRLVPLSPIIQLGSLAPEEAEAKSPLVSLRKRTKNLAAWETAAEIPFEQNHPVAVEVRQKLKLINRVNRQHKITARRTFLWGEMPSQRQKLLPRFRAIFSGSFELHGRLYTGALGHQSLSKIERKTIKFDGEPTEELDFAGLHCRLLYHLKGLEFVGDPYALWGDQTTAERRRLAKLVVNALINAASPVKAVAACNSKLQQVKGWRGSKRIFKRGKELEEARKIQKAIDAAGESFLKICARAQKFHRPIRDSFGSDQGIKLMRIDSRIALAVMFRFAKEGKPCLSCHDSFIVARSSAPALRAAMIECYLKEVDYVPIVKRG